MYSLVKTFQRTHNSISTMHTRKQPTLPFFWLKSCAFFCCFICHLYCFLHVLLDDLIFHLCVPSSHIVPSLPLFPKTIKLRKKLAFEIHTSHCHFTAFFSLCHKIHWTFSCYPSLQSSFPASACISSKLLFIFPSLHKLLSKFLALSWLYFRAWAVPWTFCCSFTYGFSILCCLPLPVPAAVFCGVSLSHCCPFS